MCQHHELSYALPAPGLVMLACVTPATEGGVTGLADAGDVLEALPSDVVDRFERLGWLLTRSYSEEIGASWAAAFGTEDPTAVERYCRRHGIETSWQSDGTLRTRQRRRAVVTHASSGRRCWFNQVAFLSQWTLDPDVREFLVDGVRCRRAAVQHLVRRRLPGRGGGRHHDQRGVRGDDPSRALAGRGRDGHRQRQDRTQPGTLLGRREVLVGFAEPTEVAR